MSCNPTKKDAEEAAAKLKLMKKPTKPKNMFLRFSTAERLNVKKYLKSLGNGTVGSKGACAKDVAHELGQRWKKLTKEQRDAYKGDYDAEVAAYEIKMKEYRSLMEHYFYFVESSKEQSQAVCKVRVELLNFEYSHF